MTIKGLARTGFRIGDWEVFPQENRVKGPDGESDLEPKVMDVLVLLASSEGEVVTRQQILDSVWADVVVGDEVVSRAISLLRKQLGEDQKNPRYLKTVSKRGYCLIADVIPLAASEPHQDEPSTARATRKVPFIIVTALVLAYVAFNFFSQQPGPDETPTNIDRSIAVLPFEDVSSSGDQAYFSNGIADELRLELQQLDGLRVAGRTSSIAYAQDAGKTISGTLNVDSLLEGSIRKEGNNVRITVHLTNVADGLTIWAESYDRELANIFEMQEEIATSVAGALGVRLGVGEINAFRGAGTRNVEAYEAYLQSQSQDRTKQEKIRLLERAVELDPNYAVAWSWLGHRTLSTVWDTDPDQASEIVDRAYSLVVRGVELNPDSAAAQRSLAVVRGAKLDWIGGEQGFLRAMELLADRQIVSTYASVLLRVGRTTEAQKHYDLAEALEPLGGQPVRMSWHASLAQARFAEAREISDWPGAANPIENYLDIALNESDPAVLVAAIQALPKTSVAYSSLYAQVLAELDSPEQVLAMLREVYRDENLQWPRKLHDIAMVAAYFGDHQFALTVKGQEIRASTVRLAALWYPVMSEVRQLPEFKELVRDLNLVEYWRAYGWADACRAQGDEDFSCT
ncbi:MAG: winged helix-turn-helix domain-containing tetratricopeptide repeat protein [Woeseiaceae bacterium]